ncbi:hypothetical protein PS732_03246 [Pseudomonas fluorescens]|uniref:Uncharacterized protein n=1 Tax=Pseudomonas fluorescens TaxID=294 RepID=A0ABD7VHI7_PSEFL|nr:hypothetical protein PS732_03246 [Pseudomonas fluorescens]
MRDHRFEATNQLVLALSTGIETLITLGNRVVHALIKTGFEVQPIKLGQTAPITSVKTVAPHQTERHGHRP